MHRIVMGALVVGLIAGCGGADDESNEYKEEEYETPKPKAEEACDTPGVGQCDGPNVALLCEGNVWRALPCRGPGGCAEGLSLYCDATKNVEGDACAGSMKDLRTCNVSNPKEILVCDGMTMQSYTVCDGQCMVRSSDNAVGCDDWPGAS